MIFGRNEQRDDAKLSSPALREERPDSVGERTPSELATTTLGPLPVPRHLVEQLRHYPRLRDLVLGYLLVQERAARYADIMTDLDQAGQTPDRPFWARLSGKLEGLRADFPNNLLGDQEFARHVTTFDSERDNAYTAAMAGRSPHQSAQSADAAYRSVTEILRAAEELAALCKGEARNLLNELYDAVSKIFADEEDGPRVAAGATERLTGMSLSEEEDALAPSVRGLQDKPLQRSAAVPDFETHLLAKRGAT